MRVILSVLAILALAVFSVPAVAQQETNTGQDKPTQGQKAGDQGMTNDAAQPATPQAEPSQVKTPEPTATTDENVTQRAAEEETTEGGAMPTTASPLPGLALAGLLLIGAGFGLRYLGKRS
jgi:cobalamin biosynthesis Mg chelatase CobN